jgi:hypothetical protein
MGRSEHFYHGTTSAIKDGMVRPANATDRYVSEHSMGDPGDMSEGDHAFVIRNHENYAWHAANNFHTNGMRPRVYETEPAADMKPGPWNREHPDFEEHHEYDPGTMPEEEKARQHQDEWASKTGFKVRQRIDIMPGRQGTFSEFNWNRFKEGGHRSSMGYDVNHPTDAQVKYGTKLESSPEYPMAEAMHNDHLSDSQFHDWKKDPAPHSPLREAAGRPQKRWATLLD